MSTDFADMTAADLLRAAIQEIREAAREHGWDERTTQFALGQTYAGTVKGDAELEAVWSAETGPAQARLDLHLTEGSVQGHAAPADKFAALVAGVADATREVARKRLGRRGHPSALLVRGAAPGSVRLVLEVAAHADDTNPGSMVDTSTVDSEALRQVAAILANADDMSDDSTITAQIGPLSGQARKALRRAADQIAAQHWHVTGTLEQRGFAPAEVAISPAGASRLAVELQQAPLAPKPTTLFGQVDGTIDIEGIVWFKPEVGRRFRCTATDQEVAQAALALQQGHPRVQADFLVYESFSSSNDVLTRSWELRAIAGAPLSDRAAQGELPGSDR